MRRHRHARHDHNDVSADRKAEIADVIGHVTRWAVKRRDVLGLLLVGSCARESPRPDSDIDLIVIVEDQDQYSDRAWTVDVGLGEPSRVRWWGVVCEWRFVTSSGLEVEINIASPRWASTDPVDAGTRRVVCGGARPLHDPVGILAELLPSCGC